MAAIKSMKGILGQFELFHKMYGLDSDFVPRVKDHGMEQTLPDDESENEGGTDYAEIIRQRKRLADGRAKGVVRGNTKGIGPGTGGPAPAVAGKQSGTGQLEQTGDSGDKKPDTNGGAKADLTSNKAIRVTQLADRLGKAAKPDAWTLFER